MNEEKKIPVHVSMIMDGNGRWARERGEERIRGHVEGVESVRACTEAAVEAGVRYLSLFLMEMMVKSISNELPVLMKNRVRFVVLGNRARLGDSLNSAIDECMEQTRENDRMTLIVFLSYSGKWDILQAAKRLAVELSENPDRMDSIMSMEVGDFDGYLVTAGIPDPDLIVRTSGEKRISNYMLWQSAYSEFFFTDILWPDFRKEQFMAALDDYAKRDRRYGKVK